MNNNDERQEQFDENQNISELNDPTQYNEFYQSKSEQSAQNKDATPNSYPPINNYTNPHTGKPSDFHLSFWPMLAAISLFPILFTGLLSYGLFIDFLYYDLGIGGLIPFIMPIIAIILRVILAKKNYYLAKGFMWAVFISILVPIIITALLFGTCLVLYG